MVESSIEFEKFRRNWSEKNSVKRSLRIALTQRLASTVARQVVSQSTMKFASCDDDPENSVNAYLWVGVH
ncbi:hypothetical protein [Leptospira noguchii]|uniref:Uncharacterized protein n=1 Tax=Leptospira noguchii TaxID=28182 RepID=A0AAE9GK62_9LEPT|nr:hypothetical protein [Leptospira noguchii]UOG57340.1 hypothetical protein MAL03_04015 [Leptospira noguchii]